MECLVIVFIVIAIILTTIYFLSVEKPKPVLDATSKQIKTCSSLHSRFEKKVKPLLYSTTQVFLFKDVEFKVLGGDIYCYELNSFSISVPCFYVYRDGVVRVCESFLEHKSFMCYKDKIDWKLAFVEDFLKEAVVHTSYRDQLYSLLKPHVREGNWVEIGEGSYYSDGTWSIYRFSDWELMCGKVALEAIQGLDIKVCENPKKTHWKHFLELEMKAKKQREFDCKVFIDSILSKQQEYNDLQLKYEMLPSAPIKDYESFTNFCKIVNEAIKFESYEITNMLLLKREEL